MQTHVTSRSLVRRWYGQIKGQPERITAELKNLVAHTIVPSCEMLQFGKSDFVPLSGCLDVVLHSEVNSAGDVTGLTMRAYRSSYDLDSNTMTIGGPNNFLMTRDLRQRPGKEASGLAIDSERELAFLLAGLDMDAERECAMRNSAMLRQPRWAQALMSFGDEQAPKPELTEGFMNLALYHLEPDADALSSLCAPPGYEGRVTRILSDSSCGVVVLELADCEGHDPLNLVYELPLWATLYVQKGDNVRGGTPLAGLTLSDRVLAPIYAANRTTEDVWDAVTNFIDDRDMDILVRHVWESNVFKWAGMTMAPNQILPQQQASKACGVWRDLRGTLNRVCHSHLDPSEIVRNNLREGRISAWPGSPQEALVVDSPLGRVDLASLPAKEFELKERESSVNTVA